MPSHEKPEKHPVYKFFTNGFVQGVAVFIALAVAFSGKLDSHGTLVAVLVAGAIGATGIYTHLSNTVRKRIIATFSIIVYGCLLWAFYSYLTSKPSALAVNTGIQQQDAKAELLLQLLPISDGDTPTHVYIRANDPFTVQIVNRGAATAENVNVKVMISSAPCTFTQVPEDFYVSGDSVQNDPQKIDSIQKLKSISEKLSVGCPKEYQLFRLSMFYWCDTCVVLPSNLDSQGLVF